MKKLISILILLATLLLLLTSCGNSKTHHVEMTFEGFGTVKIELYGDIAPITVMNFIDLAKSGYYDGTKITRMEKDFVLQGGQGAGTTKIKGEFSQNGFDNELKHTRGTISMARSTGMDTASDQFFICLSDAKASSLDGKYAAFGQVTDGMDVIDAIVDSFGSDDFLDGYYGAVMGFLKQTSYVKITSVKVIN